MKAVFRRCGDRTLEAVDQQGLDLLASLRANRDVLVEVKQARNPKQHRKLFSILNFIVTHVEQFRSTDQALTGLKIACGLVDTYIDPDTGKAFFTPRSISFSSMDQGGFASFYDRAVYVITNRWMPPGTTEESVRTELEAMVAPRERAA